METEHTFTSLNSGVIAAIVIVAMLISNEVGYRFARRCKEKGDSSFRSQFTTLEAAVLGIVGLLLGFSFSMVATRFDLRKQSLVRETNAIGTAYLRAEFLPPAQRAQVEALL